MKPVVKFAAALALILVSVPCVAEARQSSVVQSYFIQRQTTTGCLFWDNFHSGSLGNHDAYRWSEPCTPGQMIDGQGTLDMGTSSTGIHYRTGRMIQGYWHGIVQLRMDPASRQLGATQHDYNMGCMTRYFLPDGRGWGPPRLACTPGVVSGARPTPSAASPPPSAQEGMSERTRALMTRASRGDAAAQGEIGLQYLLGVGLPQNDAEALRWLRLAAAQGNADAYAGLARAYERGSGVPRDEAEAARLYEQAVISNPDHHLSIAALRRIEAQQRQNETRQWQSELSGPSRSWAASSAGDRPILTPDRTWVDPVTGAPCVTQTAQHHEDSGFWRTYHLVLSNRCNLAFRIRAEVDRWDSNPLYQEQARVIHRRRSGNDPSDLRLTCWEARRPSRTYEIGCRGFRGWSVAGAAEGG